MNFLTSLNHNHKWDSLHFVTTVDYDYLIEEFKLINCAGTDRRRKHMCMPNLYVRSVLGLLSVI